MNKKVKANTVKRFHYHSIEALKAHLYAYLLNYNFNLKLRAIGRMPPFQSILNSSILIKICPIFLLLIQTV